MTHYTFEAEYNNLETGETVYKILDTIDSDYNMAWIMVIYDAMNITREYEEFIGIRCVDMEMM